MKFSSLSFAAVLSAPLLLALAMPADDLSFHPAAKSEAAKTLTINVEMNIKDASFTMNGEPIPGDALDSIKENSLIMNMSAGVTDKYVETKDGKPVELLRTYDKLKMEAEFGEDSKEVDEFKVLEGKTVQFKWNEKESAYDKTFHESEGDPEDIKELSEDMDLRALLPEKKVSAGDTWEVPAKGLLSVFIPGGLLVMNEKGDNAEQAEMMKKAIEGQLDQFLKDFKVVCTYKGSHDDGGTKVGEITFTFDGKAKLDMGSMMEEIIQSQAPAGAPEMDITATVGIEFKGDGTLLWDATKGIMNKFDMKSDVGLDVDIDVNAKQGDTPIEVSMSGAAEGKITWEMGPAK
jgi:hypothetical protein